MPDCALVIPARLNSSRFPRKLLAEVLGRPLICWTAEAAHHAAEGLPLYFAVAGEELAGILREAGYETILTDPDLPSGTDRLAAANREIGADIVINIQADEPLVTARQVRQLRDLAASDAFAVGTLARRFTHPEAFYDPNHVKVVVGSGGRALYFSRAAIPYARDRKGEIDEAFLAQAPVLHHLGVYAYTADFLETYARLSPGKLEETEKLEQLRALENGYAIGVGETQTITVGVDVPADIPRLECAIEAHTAR